MGRRGHRILTAVLVVAIVALAVRLVIIVTDDDGGVDTVETTETAYSVEDALGLGGRGSVAVTGYVYDDASLLGTRLCHGLVAGDPPRCQGPYLTLTGLDESRLDLETDGSLRWTPDPVTLLGSLSVDRMSVTEILS